MTGVQTCALPIYLSKANASSSTKSTQQQQKVTGKVVDANNEPLIGVSVLEKGTTNGTIIGRANHVRKSRFDNEDGKK